jgi:hypothetical protein
MTCKMTKIDKAALIVVARYHYELTQYSKFAGDDGFTLISNARLSALSHALRAAGFDAELDWAVKREPARRQRERKREEVVAGAQAERTRRKGKKRTFDHLGRPTYKQLQGGEPALGADAGANSGANFGANAGADVGDQVATADEQQGARGIP